MRKKIITAMLFCLIVLVSTSTVFAATSSYSGTYDMTGGIFVKKDFNVDSFCKINITPSIGTSNCNMGVYTAKNSFLWGWSACDFIANVSSVSASSTTYRETGTYGIYFRDWAGQRWTGKFSISWD